MRTKQFFFTPRKIERLDATVQKKDPCKASRQGENQAIFLHPREIEKTGCRLSLLDRRGKWVYNNIEKKNKDEHMKRIYFDHAATTPIDEEVLQKMLPYFRGEYGNADSPHAIGRRAMNAVDNARDIVASLIGAKPNEVYFTSGGTESDNWAMFGGAYAQNKRAEQSLLCPRSSITQCMPRRKN